MGYEINYLRFWLPGQGAIIVRKTLPRCHPDLPHGGEAAVLGEVAQVVSELQILTAGQIREDYHGATSVNLPD